MLPGPGFSELLRPDIVRPLLENLQLEDRLAPYLPEVPVHELFSWYPHISYVFCVYL